MKGSSKPCRVCIGALAANTSPREQQSRSGLPLIEGLRLRIAIARKNNRSSSHRAAAAAQRALLDAARLLGSTLPLHYHHGSAEASHARRVFLRQDADLIDRRRRDRLVEYMPLLGLPAALRRAVLREFIDAAQRSAQIMSLTPSTRTCSLIDLRTGAATCE